MAVSCAVPKSAALVAPPEQIQELLDEANRSKQEKIRARRAQVAELAQRSLSVGEISSALNVSPKTIRRDLEALEIAA